MSNVPLEMRLWKAGDIAEYLGLNKRYVAENLVHRPGFPKPLKRIYKYRQWKAIDVIRWRENPPAIKKADSQ